MSEKKSIIELLGIKAIKSWDKPHKVFIPSKIGKWCLKEDVREKETIFNEMLEALIEEVQIYYKEFGKTAGDICFRNQLNIKIIEKACHPLKWPEIKEILNG